MSAETIPADVLAIARESVAKEARKEGAPWSLVQRIREGAEDHWRVPTAVAAIIADRSTRSAEPAPEVEVGDGEVVAWAKPRGPWVMGEKFIWSEDRNEDWMKGIFTEPLVRLSALEAELAKNKL